MRTLVIGDIHGGYRALLQVFERAEVTIEDTLIFLGDYVDGWSESAQLVDFLIQLNAKQKCIFIRGNHDVWCGTWLEKGKSNPIWLAHGGEETINSYIKSELISKKKEHRKFFKKLKNFYLDRNNRLFLHAGFTSRRGVTKELLSSNFYFDRTLWQTVQSAYKINNNTLIGDNMPQRCKLYNEIYIGHTPTTFYKQSTPMKAYNVWNVDTGAAFKGKLTILDIDSKEIWQSDPLPKLYPNEKGRN